MAIITYAGWSFPFETDDGEHRVVMSDDGADYLYTEKTWTVEAVLQPGLQPAGLTFAAWIDRLQHDLESPRRDLVINFGSGVPLVTVTSATDCKNGPIPKIITFTKFAGGSSCLLRFQVTAHVRNCDSGGQLLSHRWEEDVDLDGKTFLTTRTRTGRILIRPGALTADDFRDIATPPVPVGFRPGKSKYKVLSNGLGLEYTIVHEQIPVGIPPGAIDADGESRVVSDKGIWKHVEVSVRLTGDPTQSKSGLVALAILIATTKLKSFGLQNNQKTKSWQVLSGFINEKLYKNEITVVLRTLLSQPKKPKAAATAGLKFFWSVISQGPAFAVGNAIKGAIDNAVADEKPGDDPRNNQVNDLIPKSFELGVYDTPPSGSELNLSPDLGLRSTAGLKLVAAALNDPCLSILVNGNVNELVSGGTPFSFGVSTDLTRYPEGSSARTTGLVGQARGEPPVNPAQVEIVPDLPPDLPDPENGGLYTDYRIWREITRDSGKIPLTEQKVNGNTQLIAIRAASRKLVCRWTAERVGEPPDPLPLDLGGNTLPYLTIDSDGSVEDTTADGVTVICRRSGEYHYAVVNPMLNELIGMSLPPWVADSLGLGSVPVILGGPPNTSSTNPGTNTLVGGPG